MGVSGTGGRGPLFWLRAARAPFFTAAAVPVLLGAALAHAAVRAAGASWSWPLFAWTLAGALCAAAGTNLINDWGDDRSGADACNPVGGNPFTGGSRMIQLGLLSPAEVLRAALLCFAATVLIGLGLNAVLAGSPLAPTPLLGLGLLGCLLGVAYSAGPAPLSYRGLGELAVALGFGPVIVLGSSWVLTAGRAPWPLGASLATSVPVALFILLVLWINQFQDQPADAASGKRNWVVRLAGEHGRLRGAFAVWVGLNLAGFAAVTAVGLLLNRWALLALLPLPLFLRAAVRGRAWVARWEAAGAERAALPFELLDVNAATIGVHLGTGVLLAAAWII